MNNPLFSILVANYNNGHFFKDCYESIINQTYINWEVIIVDDASTDNSIELIKLIVGNDSRFKIFANEENKGCGYTKNRCAELAQGELLGFLDSDDALTIDALSTMSEAHCLNEGVAIITSKYEFVDLKMNFKEVSSQGGDIPDGQSYLTSMKGILTHFATFKNQFFKQTAGIDEKMKRAVDQDLYYKLEEQGKHLFIDKVLYRYRINDNSISANENVFKAKYWHFYTMLKAYERRKSLETKIDNLTSVQIKKLKSNYYFSRFEKAKKEKKKNISCYFLYKSIIAFPTYNFKSKIKALSEMISI